LKVIIGDFDLFINYDLRIFGCSCKPHPVQIIDLTTPRVGTKNPPVLVLDC